MCDSEASFKVLLSYSLYKSRADDCDVSSSFI